MITTTLLNSVETLELEIHRAKTGLVDFKPLAMRCFDKGEMTHGEFLILNAAAEVSKDFNDCLTLNKMTILFNNRLS